MTASQVLTALLIALPSIAALIMAFINQAKSVAAKTTADMNALSHASLLDKVHDIALQMPNAAQQLAPYLQNTIAALPPQVAQFSSRIAAPLAQVAGVAGAVEETLTPPGGTTSTTTSVAKVLLLLLLPAVLLFGQGCTAAQLANNPLSVVSDTTQPTAARLAAADQIYATAAAALIFAKQSNLITQSEWNAVVVPANNAYQSAMNSLQAQLVANPSLVLDGNSVWTALLAALSTITTENQGVPATQPTSQPNAGAKYGDDYVAYSCYPGHSSSDHNNRQPDSVRYSAYI